MRVVVYAPDLADRSRIEAALPASEVVRSLDVLAERAAGADLVIVDLDRPGVADVLDAVVQAARRVVGYGPHVAVEQLDAATTAGVEAMPRSRFFADVASAAGIHP